MFAAAIMIVFSINIGCILHYLHPTNINGIVHDPIHDIL